MTVQIDDLEIDGPHADGPDGPGGAANDDDEPPPQTDADAPPANDDGHARRSPDASSPPPATPPVAFPDRDPGSVADACNAYLSLGWAIVPVLSPTRGGPAPGKRPGLGTVAAWRALWEQRDAWHPDRPEPDRFTDGCAWEFLRLRPPDLELLGSADRNVGVNLGEPSGGLADLDLDCGEARELAPRFMRDRDGQPWQTWRFGRDSAPCSHWLFVSPGAVSVKFCDLQADGRRGGATICELRATAPHATGRGIGGHQTVLPPSLHKSGEIVQWDPDAGDSLEAPRTVDPAELTTAVRQLAAASLVLRHCARAAVFAWLEGRAPCPALPRAVGELARELWGLTPVVAVGAAAVRPSRARRVTGSGPGWIDTVRDAGVAPVARAFGLEVIDRGGRPAWLRPCPACAETVRGRSSPDKRAPAELTSDGRGFRCYRCQDGHGDAVSLAALLTTGRRDGLSRDEWLRVRRACEARGVIEVRA